MKRILFLLFFCSICSAQPDWVELPEQAAHFKFYRSTSGKNKWLGVPDPNYSWDGDRLSWERTVKNEDGNDVTVKTYRNPIEIIAAFNPASKVFGIKGKIERTAVKKFGGSLKGFVWLDKVKGGGEVVLPFTAPHIFIAKGDQLNPVLSEISTDTSAENFYEIIDGKTHVYVKSFSGIGGAAGSPATLIAHYKMNEDTASDNDEKVGNGDFSTWTVPGTPTGWTVTGESGNDPEVDEAATGEKHSDTPTLGGGMCNMYSSGVDIRITRSVGTFVVGRKYRFSINLDTVTTGSLLVADYTNENWTTKVISATTTFTFTAVSTSTTLTLRGSTAIDITFDDVSIKLLAVEDSSGNDHDGLLQEDTDAAHVTGKTGTGAFDFDGSSDSMVVAADPEIDIYSKTAYSISSWIYPHSDGEGDNGILFSKGDAASSGYKLEFYADSGGLDLKFRMAMSGTNVQIIKANAIPLNQWTHLVLTFSNTTKHVKYYHNGTLQSLDTDTAGTGSPDDDSGDDLYIGNRSANDRTFDGLIDNVMFFSQELDSGEVGYLWNGGAGREEWEVKGYRARYRARYSGSYRNRY